MATQMDDGNFNLIISGVDSARLDEATQHFAKVFSIEPAMAGQITKSAPLLFATGLSKKEVKSITPTLRKLSKQGNLYGRYDRASD